MTLTAEEKDALRVALKHGRREEGEQSGLLCEKNAGLSAMGYQLINPGHSDPFPAHFISAMRKLALQALIDG